MFGTSNQELYRFYEANIHERRFAARFFRVLPLMIFLVLVGVIIYSVIKDQQALLCLCAILNTALWLWLVSTCLLGIYGTFLVQRELEDKDPRLLPNARAQVGPDSVTHVIVFPNYKEDEAILEETLRSLVEAEDSHLFQIVLAMEAREQGSDVKAESLKRKFKDNFAFIDSTFHPDNLTQIHNDKSYHDEIPGKAPNVKWALRQTYARLEKHGQSSLNSVMVTVSDADCLFHPKYFSHISREFNVMRSESPGKQHEWTMWQAPQLSFRDHWGAPLCSRTWTYVSSMYEFGGVSGLHCGGHHMLFSSYSLPLLLACQKQSWAWDGDIVAEDHHVYLKSYFYSVYEAAQQSLKDGSGCDPLIRVRPVFLPVKSTPVISSQGYWSSYTERWSQATRHAQGVAELPYALLATWDMFWTLPVQTYSFKLFYTLGKVLIRLWCMHILPLCQFTAFAVLTLYWMFHGMMVPMCPNYLTFETWSTEPHYVLCGLAGAWTFVWPIVVPFALLILANYFFATSCFITPAEKNPDSGSLWYEEDGCFEPYCGSKRFAAFCSTVFDGVVLLAPTLAVYALIPMIIAYWNVAFYGNQITYVSASKQTKATSGTYGSMNSAGNETATSGHSSVSSSLRIQMNADNKADENA